MAVAQTMALRSRCSRDQVGAVIVSATNRIIDTGYNGPPAHFVGTMHLGFDPVQSCASWCPRAIRGEFIEGNREDLPRNVSHHPTYDDCPSLHAEANALMFSDRRLRQAGTIYVTSGTCGGCAKLVANSGLVRAVYAASRRPDGAVHRDSLQWYDFLRKSGVEVVLYEPKQR